MEELIAQYKVYLVEEKRSSDNTVQSYVRDVRTFSAYLKEGDFESFSSVAEEDIVAYLDVLQNIGRSLATIARAVASLKAFFSYLCAQGLLSANPVCDISVKKAERKSPEILTNKEVDLLLAQPNQKDMKGCRDRAMLELLYATGIRVSELVELNVQDVNFDLGFIRCNAKAKARTIPLYPVAVRCVMTYLKEVRPYITNSNSQDALFINFSGSRLSRQGFWKIIKKYTQSAHINKRITPHTLRHSFSAHMLENGADIKFIQEILGHSDIATTQMYAKMLTNRVRQIYISHHPRA